MRFFKKFKYPCNIVKLFNLCISLFFRLENPIDVPKTANTKITTLQIQEQQYFGSLTCHVLRDTSNSIFNHFNATTRGLAFSNADTYDPYNFGKKREKFYNCDIYLTNSDFPDLAVDLEIVLILQPLLRRQSINVCDVPLITRQTVHIEFAEGNLIFESTLLVTLLLSIFSTVCLH